MSARNTDTPHKKALMRRLCILLDVLMLVIVGCFMTYVVMSSPRQRYDVDRSVYPLKGLDISAHNGEVDFLRAAADSVTFVMLKATEGTDFCDARFNVNYWAAKFAGLKVGAYHFFRFDTPGDVQAHHFMASLQGRHFDLPLAVDVEKWGNITNFDPDSVKKNLHLMVQTIQKEGYPLMLYTNKQGYNAFIRNDFEGIPLWICSLSSPPTHDDWTFWQHSHRSHVDGVKGRVDVNTFNGSHEQFERWLQSYVVNIAPVD